MQTYYKETATFRYTNYFSFHSLKGVNTGFAKGEAQIRHAQHLIKNDRFSNMLERIENTQNKVLTTVSLEFSSAGETVCT